MTASATKPPMPQADGLRVITDHRGARRVVSGNYQNSRMSAEEREVKLGQLAELMLRGVSRVEAALQLGVNSSTVFSWIKIIDQRWRESALRDFDALRGREIAHLDLLQKTYWEGYVASRGTKTKKRTEFEVALDRKTGQRSPQVASVVTDEHEEAGDPRFLDGMYKCIVARAKLLGLDATEPAFVAGQVTRVVAVSADGDAVAEQYRAIFGLGPGGAVGGAPVAALAADGASESLDSEPTAPETGDLPDAH